MGTQNRRLGSVQTVNDSFENRRLSLQTELDAYKTIEERRKLGQFATPTLLARDIVAYGLKHLSTPQNIRFLDPAFGTVAFYSALLEVAHYDDISEATAVEIDPLFANTASNLWLDYGINIINDDLQNLCLMINTT
ncbi:hypothetical protein FACS1894208_05960 [Clostridia bacterium]|nr:hypothetical protein FACS1894208_05960 [Clostridia bacterium]